MLRSHKILRIGLALFSACTSFLLIYYAVGIMTGNQTAPQLQSLAYLAGGYGLVNIYILSWSWRAQVNWASTVNLLIAVCFFSAVTVEQFRGGLQNQMQILALFGLSMVLGVNWFAIKFLCRTPAVGKPTNLTSGRRY